MASIYENYFKLLMKWNERMNLMSVKTFDEFLGKHIEDSKVLLPYISDSKSLIDLGSGAGVPAIPVKIERPDLKMTMIEATRKKVSFCEEAIRQLGLNDIVVVWGRAEDESLARSVGVADVVISRATWDLKTYIQVAERYIANDGKCIAMKGSKWNQELEDAGNALDKTGLSLERVHEYTLAAGEKRCIVILAKISE